MTPKERTLRNIVVLTSTVHTGRGTEIDALGIQLEAGGQRDTAKGGRKRRL